MKIIIAPTKKQNTETPFEAISTVEFLNHSQSLRSIMENLTKKELQDSLKTSDKLTEQVHSYYQENQPEVPAAALYSGAVFTAAEILSWEQSDLNYAQEKLIILSALYGPLRPLDNVRPYRLDFFTKIDINLYDYWNNAMKEFNRNLKGPIINLASKEFSKMIPQDLLVDIIFLEANGKTQATNAKIARGTMLKFIIQNKLDCLNDLKKFNQLGYTYVSEKSNQQALVFSRQESIKKS